MKKVVLWCVFGVVCAGIVGCARDVTLNKEPVLFEVEKGESLNRIASRLAQNRIIRDSVRFKVRAKIRGYDKKLQAGTYQIMPGESLDDLIQKMVSGRVYARRVTILEGWSIYDIAKYLVKENLITQEADFYEACRRVDLVADLGVKGIKNLEGFLFPDTYSVSLDMTVYDIVKMMVNQFKHIVTPKMREALCSRGLSLLEAVTLASIVEKETSVEYEKPLVAGVLYNRLRIRMKLQTDPTLIYIRQMEGTWDGNIRKRDFTNESPYNTYKYYGLPPGPIANPGKSALLAVAYPAQTDYLYFVSKNDGTHYFSSTLQEHAEAVRRYQMRK
ncbi:MAG: endolytic transglycosylase MltG [Brevinematales bacterium]|nr:endolytic transglycosylase MltG [Brevinematales bacterium]